jgi:hypothetical protein
MKHFATGEKVKPKARLLPIDSGNSERGGLHQITTYEDLLVNTASKPNDGEQMLTFRGRKGSYSSSFFVRV